MHSLHFHGKTVLHVGCGGSPLPTWMDGAVETRLDIDAQHNPHIVADMRNIGNVNKYDIVFSSHALEHLYPHEIVPTLTGFKNALNSGGRVIVIVPNLEGICATDDVVYISPSGAITGLDMIYGKLDLIESMPYMAHHMGFTKATLEKCLKEAGFDKIVVSADSAYNLIGAAE